MKIAVKNMQNKKVGDIDLNDEIFGLPLRKDLLQRMVRYQLAKRRSGSHESKTRGEIVGGAAKPYRQKGTGRARQGSLRGPHMVGGGVAFGPHNRDHGHKLNKKVKALALKTALSAKLAEEKLIILDDLSAKSHKTKDMAASLKGLDLSSALIIGDETLDENFVRAARNIPLIDVLPVQGANVYDILRRDVLVLSKSAVTKLEERLS